MKWSIGKQLLATQPSATLCFPPQQLTATSIPLAPCCSTNLPRKGNAVLGKKPILLPLRAWQLWIDGPRAGGGLAEGWGAQLCVCRYARRGWQQPGFVSYIKRKIMFPWKLAQWFEEWLSCLHILSISASLWCLNLSVMSNEWGKAY